jgi:hypothetical protein
MEWVFRHSVWLFPMVFLVHVFEERPRFTTGKWDTTCSKRGDHFEMFAPGLSQRLHR